MNWEYNLYILIIYNNISQYNNILYYHYDKMVQNKKIHNIIKNVGVTQINIILYYW